MKPRWKTIVELIISAICMFVGASMASTNAVWPPQLPEWIGLGLGFLVIIVFLEKIRDRWNEL